MRNLKKVLALVLALAMSMSLVTIANAADFSDSKDISYKEAVDVMSAVGIIDGLDTGAFNPQGTLTREQAAKIICTMMLGSGADKLGTTSSSFKDVAATRWSSPYIEYCASIGIIAGNGDGTYNPTGKLTGYAFAKMLLGALGYKSEYEGYTGAGWTIEVAKDAVTAGITVDGVAMNAQLTREQATQMAFQAMQATMVEYKTAGSSVVLPDGTQIVTSGSTASKVENNDTKAGFNGEKDGYQQFCEEYFSDLKKNTNATDDFSRPADKWTYKTTNVGTYAKAADATYTKDVELGDIYADLGLSKTTKATYSRNGEAKADVTLSRGSSVKLGTGNGVLTQAYVDDNANVTLVSIDTYAGTVSRSVAATSSKDAYIVVSAADVKPANFKGEYETEVSYADDTVVLYTYSASANKIVSVQPAESVEGKVTKIVAGKSLDLDNSTYECSAKIAGDAYSIDGTYTVYTDTYGYAIYVDEQEFVSGDYAYVLAATNGDTWTQKQAKLVFTDGSTKIVTTEKGYADYASSFVTYKVNADNTYTLRKVTGTQTIGANNAFDLVKGTAKVTYDSGKTLYANSNTIFLVKTGTGNDETFKSYTGIANVPSIKAGTGTVSGAYYCKTSGMLSFIYIDASKAESVSTSSKDVVFLADKSENGPITDSNSSRYYVYNAVVNGEITTVKVQNAINANMLYGSVTYDSDNVMTNGTSHSNLVTPTHAGTVKKSGDSTVGFGNSTDGIVYWTVAKDCKVYYINNDGVITETSLSGVATDTNDQVLAVKNDGELTYIFIQEIAEGQSGSSEVMPGQNPTGATVDAGRTAITVNVVDSKNSDNDVKDLAATALNNAGYTVKSWTNATSVTAYNSANQEITFGVNKVQYWTLTVNNTVVEYIKANSDSAMKIKDVKGTGTGYLKNDAYIAYAKTDTALVSSASAATVIKTGYVNVTAPNVTDNNTLFTATNNLDGKTYAAYGSTVTVTLTAKAEIDLAKTNAGKIDAGTNATLACSDSKAVASNENGTLTFVKTADAKLAKDATITISYKADKDLTGGSAINITVTAPAN